MTGCWPADCHYRVQNVKALRRFELLQRVLEQLGIEPAAVPARLRQRGRGHSSSPTRSRGSIEEVRPLGPLGWGRVPEVAPTRRALEPRRDGRGRAVRGRDRRRSPRGGGRMSTNGKHRFAMYWAAVVRRLRHQRPQPARGDPRLRRALRDRVLAGGHGRQVRRRRGDARRLDRPHPVLRRDPQHRERRARPAAAAQVGDPGRLRLVRQRRAASPAWRT